MKYYFPLSPYNQQRQFEKPVWVYPAHLAMYATHLRNHGHEVWWGHNIGILDNPKKDGKLYGVEMTDDMFDEVIRTDDQIDVPFEQLPFPDRRFTDALNKRWQGYGNYKFHPATHSMASNLCWYGKCTFCVDTFKLQSGEKRGLRTVDHFIEEVEDCAKLGIKEIFDDSGTFPLGKWLEEFCEKMISTGLNKKIVMGCNMRVQDAPWALMKKAGFRFILMGVESSNQITLDKIKKSQRAEDIVYIIAQAAKAGLEPHGTFMTGYPWETEKDEKRTISLAHYLLEEGYLKTAQASVYSPPRTKPDPNSSGHKYLPRFYDVYRSPKFWLTKLKDLRRWEDFTYYVRGARLVAEEKARKAWHNLSHGFQAK